MRQCNQLIEENYEYNALVTLIEDAKKSWYEFRDSKEVLKIVK